MINEITQSISPITPLPGLLAENRLAAVNTLVEEELPQNSIEMQSLVGQVNTFVSQTNATADQVLANATLASNAAAVAVANANYKGDWVAGFNTTGYSLGMSVTYTDGYNYSSKINNNLTEPTTLQNTTEWNFIEAVNPNNYYLKTETDSITSINNKTDKATPLDTDNFMIQETGGLFKKLSWANIKATLKTYFDTLYFSISASQSKLGTDNLLMIQDQKASGTIGDALTLNAWKKTTKNTVLINNIIGASVSGSVITLPAGTYYVESEEPVGVASTSTQTYFKSRLYNVSDSTNILIGNQYTTRSNSATNEIRDGMLTIHGIFTLTATKNIKIDIENIGVIGYNGFSIGISGIVEVYGTLKIWKVA